MKTSPGIQRVLIYGDSFVYGKTAGRNERLAPNVRFTGRLQALLGEEYEVIEEGLRARTLAGENGFFPERDGLAQFGPVIGSHLGFDALVIMLGTNDCNARGDVSPEHISGAVEGYARKLCEWSEFLAVKLPRVLLVSPPFIDESHFDDSMRTVFGEGAGERSRSLATALEPAARAQGWAFLDAANVCSPSAGDGIHLDAEDNDRLARALSAKNLFSSLASNPETAGPASERPEA